MSDADNAFGKVVEGVFGNAGTHGRTAPGGSEILDAGQLLISGMRLTTGWGRPDPGEAFGHGAAGFTGAGQTVASAHPRDEWVGTGSQSYASANRRQSGSAATLAVLDRDVQTVVAREAFQVDYHRGALDAQSDHLSALGYATWSLALVPGVGKALKAAVEMTAVNTALLVCGTELANLASETGENAAELRRLADGYSALTRKTAPPALDDEPPPPPADEERRSDADPAPAQASGRDPESVLTAAEPSSTTSAPAAVPTQTHCEPAAPAPTAEQAVSAPAAPADPMAAMSSVFGAVGGAIGSVVAPLAAALTGVAAAAGQALSTATSAQPAASTDGTPEPATSSTDEDPEDEPAGPGVDDDDVAEPTVPDAVAEPGTSAAPPPPVAEPPRPPAPAATRPPQ